MSENDLSFDSSQRWSPSISAATSQILSEAEEGADGIMRGDAAGSGRQNRKKMPRPPRPPPPKWEQFHRRRASHQALLSSSSSSSAALRAVPASFDTAERHYSAHSASYVPPPDTSRQRSYSLPPERQEVAESCPRCSCNQAQTQERTLPHAPSNQNPAQDCSFTVAPPSPMFSRKAFRPVALPQSEREVNLRSEAAAPLPPPPTLPPPERPMSR